MIRTLQVPERHPYVKTVLHGVSSVGSVPDSTSPLSRRWLFENEDRFDVVHLHLDCSDDLADMTPGWILELERLGIPLVVTLHDLCDDCDPARGHVARQMLSALSAEVVLVTSDDLAQVAQRRWARPVMTVPPIAELEDVGEFGDDLGDLREAQFRRARALHAQVYAYVGRGGSSVA
jgi:glycosyltransferase involved in cell wall biosynthesis